MKNKPLIVWLSLWFVTPFFLHIRNRMMSGMGLGDPFRSFISSILVLGLPFLVISLIVWFVIKLFTKSITTSQVLVLWMILFLVLMFSPAVFQSFR